MNEPAPLPDDLLEYLDAAREPEPVPAATKARLFASLGPFLPPGGGGGSPTGDAGGGPSSIGGPSIGGATAAAGATTGLLQGKLAVAVVSAMIGALGGATVHATFAPPRTVVVSSPVAASVVTPVEQPAVTAVAAAQAAEPAPSASVAVASASSLPSEAPALRKSSMRAERILLEAANAALMRGDHATAIGSLQQHARTYPRGELAQERDILMAQAAKLKAANKGSAPR